MECGKANSEVRTAWLKYRKTRDALVGAAGAITSLRALFDADGDDWTKQDELVMRLISGVDDAVDLLIDQCIDDKKSHALVLEDHRAMTEHCSQDVIVTSGSNE